MKPKQDLRLGLDLTGADRTPEELAPAISRLRELYPQLSLRVYWPIYATIPEELLAGVTAVEHQHVSLSRLAILNRFLRRWRGVPHEGQPRALEQGLGQLSIQLVDQVISMEDEPCTALRQAPHSALPLAIEALRRKEIDALMSCGNTGALVAAAQLGLPRLPGAKRLALGARIPGIEGQADWVLADCGATLDPTADQLMRFAEWGADFAHRVLHKETLKIGLLNVGRESCKGPAVLREVYGRLMAGEGIHPEIHQFIGNVEPADVCAGEVDLVVTSGLMGNLLLKTLEFLHPAKGHHKGAARILGVGDPVFKLHGQSTSDGLVAGVAEALQQAGAEVG